MEAEKKIITKGAEAGERTKPTTHSHTITRNSAKPKKTNGCEKRRRGRIKLARYFPAQDFQEKNTLMQISATNRRGWEGKGRQKKNYILLERVVALLPVVRADDGIGGEGD
jgi:hypothetical protein